ncbi:CBS domain-containing protein [Acidisphaera sp. L21]|uniref:CBS domain-containing protein n=1 Tax=Acidisphaera sp. L21 TaxID=1641851 RepID=UPI00131C413A|nr:CBS domain-containing protein [Acidisphaera sp. L21]
MLISDVLHTKGRKVFTIRPDQTVKDAVERLAEHRIGALVVENRLKPVGIFSERDLVNRLAHSGAGVYDYKVGDLMTTPVISGHPDDTIDDMLQLMTRRRIRHLPIIESEELVGIVSLGDLVKHRFEEKELEASVLLDLTRMRS